MATEYVFPPFHSFPPSYTRQPVETTRAKQTQLWCDLIRDYCRVHRIFWLDVSVASESNLFSNAAIDRRLSDSDIRYFLGQLVARGDAEWDPDRKRCLVFWRRPSDWGQIIIEWVDSTGRNGDLLTVHEIRKGTITIGQEFHGLEPDTTMRALQALEAIGKCAIVHGDSDDSMVMAEQYNQGLTSAEADFRRASSTVTHVRHVLLTGWVASEWSFGAEALTPIGLSM